MMDIKMEMYSPKNLSIANLKREKHTYMRLFLESSQPPHATRKLRNARKELNSFTEKLLYFRDFNVDFC